jgi:hypothetical protein
MGIEIKGQDDCDGIRLVSINATSLSDVEVDLAPYYIETAHDNNAGEKSLNDVVTLPIYKSFDLLTPYNETRVTVEVKPDGEKTYSKVTSLDGVLLDGVLSNKEYQFKTEKFGSYRITIFVDDYFNDNNDNSFTYQIIVVDNIKPEVVITSASSTASVGNNLSLPKFSVSNKDDYNWYVTVKQPNNDMYYVDANKPFKFTQKGKHTVTLVVYDVNWNTTRVTYTVVVK